MEEAFDGIDFVYYVRRRWTMIALSCAIALSAAAIASIMWPKQYTATASILIQPPAGNDPRGATAISPVYLESLKTYERFAASDTVFTAAVRETHLEAAFSGRGIESVKRSVLKVSRPTSTKIVEVSITLPDPPSAQKLAQRIAEDTVALNRKLTDISTADVLRESEKSLQSAESRFRNAEKRKDELVKNEAIDTLQSEVAQANQVRLTVGEDLARTRAELADMEAEVKSFHAGDGLEAQADWTRRQIEALRARVVSQEAQIQLLNKSTDEKTGVLETRKQRRESLEAELHSARAEYELARTKLSDAQNSAAYRGEQLEIMDPGIVPQRPSFPNTPLNLLLACLFAVIASIGYLAVRFGYTRARRYADLPEYSIR